LIKKLVRHGNSLAIVIERSVIKLLGADEKTLFDVTTDGKTLILNPIKSELKSKGSICDKRKNN
jgi:antitoxin component of MazEF toxin-antitoxin module